MRKKIAVYPLSADPVHNGHMYSLGVAVNSGLFDEVCFAIGNNPDKKYLFSLEERIDLSKRAINSEKFDKTKVRVESFSGMFRNYARRIGAKFVIRGARSSRDFEYEMVLSDYNGEYNLTTFVVPSNKEYRFLSSGTVKVIVCEGGSVEAYVNPGVKQALEEKIRGISLVGVTGNMGVGKSTFCKSLVGYLRENRRESHHIDFDKLVHSFYFRKDVLGEEVREKIRKEFGGDVFDEDGLNRKKLAEKVFSDAGRVKGLLNILKEPALIEFEDRLRELGGLVLVDAAYFVEYNLLGLVNNNVVLVGCEDSERRSRVRKRDSMSEKDIAKIDMFQLSYEEKKEIIENRCKEDNHGFCLEVDNTNQINIEEIGEGLKEFFPMFKGEENVCANS